MTKLTRLTAKIFGETADATLADPQIGQFGSGKAGTYVGTADVATIQSLPAWSTGWIDAVTPTQQFPALPEMTGVHKVLSYQNAYLLQQGMPEWDADTTYYKNNFCAKDGKIYFSKTDSNLNNEPAIDTVNWEEFKSGNSRSIGEIVTSVVPLTDAGLHLLDGALIQGTGSYASFVDYIADLYDSGDYPDLFETEANWQTSVTTYGVCGKFVYDSVNNTVRLPKITGITEGTTDLTALGDLVQAGLPIHTHTKGTQNITGTMSFNGTDPERASATSTGCISTSYWTSGGNDHDANIGNAGVTFTLNATDGWTGSTSNPNYINNIQNSNTVQPQTIKVLYYIVVATSTKTEIEVDIDEIATDLNGKADTDLLNLTTIGENRLHALKGYLDEGELLTDGEGLADLTQMAHSTFDLSKFTVVGSPTITSEGVVSGFSSSDYVKGNFELGNLAGKSWKIEETFWYDKDAESLMPSSGAYGTITGLSSITRSYGYLGTSQNNKLIIWVTTPNDDNSPNYYSYTPNKSVAQSGYVYESLEFDYNTGTYTMYFKFPDGTDDTKLYTPNTTNKELYSIIQYPTDNLQFGYLPGGGLAYSPIDLTQIKVSVDGVPVFSGNKTGSDTYTIGGNTVSIPYTLSKTGSKIVDSYYRTQVSALYAQEGVAPYYTLQEGVNFTLPQGEVYGMIQNAYQNVLPDYANGITMGLPYTPTTTESTFTAPSAGWGYIFAAREGGTGGTLNVDVNNHRVAVFVGFSQFGSTAFFPVSKGDVISASVDANSTWEIRNQAFFPCKGV